MIEKVKRSGYEFSVHWKFMAAPCDFYRNYELYRLVWTDLSDGGYTAS